MDFRQDYFYNQSMKKRPLYIALMIICFASSIAILMSLLSKPAPSSEVALNPVTAGTDAALETEVTPAQEASASGEAFKTEAPSDIPCGEIPYEIPLCPRGCLLISENDTKGVLETSEKEDSHQIIVHSGYTLCYREKYEQPEWVAYTLDFQKIQKNVARKDNFRADPSVLTGSASPADYKNSGFDRGHLAPSADLTYSFETMNDSFFMSNMSPQTADFNRGIWKDLEHEVRCFAEKFDKLWIVTGPVLDKVEFNSIGQNAVAVPEFYYKAILAKSGSDFFAIGFIIPNTKCTASFWEYAVTVDSVEEKTGLDFFYLLEDDAENNIEESFNLSDWMVENE